MPAWLDRIVADAHQALLSAPETAPARAYLQARGLTDQEIVDHQIGFILPTQPILECTEEFQRWSWALPSRFVFPLTSVFGETIGIQTKPLAPKGYNLFYVHPRSLYPYMFGTRQAIDAICDRQSVVIVEGVFDYFAVRKVAPNVVAVMTAGVPQACRRFFRRYVKRVICFLDMDPPGREGAYNLAVRDPHSEYSVVTVEYSAHDPGDLRDNLSEIRRCVDMAQERALY